MDQRVIDLSLTREPPLYPFQRPGIEALVKRDDPAVGRIFPGCFALFDEMGVTKTRQVIEAAQVLYREREIDRVIVVTPGNIRSVWYEPEFGQLAKYLWNNVPTYIREFHRQQRDWRNDITGDNQLEFWITNYEFIRSKNRLTQILGYATTKTLLVLDESSMVKNHQSQQAKACLQLRRVCGRVILLNGTPIENHPGDLFSQANIMDPRILACYDRRGNTSWFIFRARYAVMGGWEQKQIIRWQNLDDLQRRMAPYILRRLKVDVLKDLPAKLEPVVLTVPFDEKTWAIYKEMRDEMVAWLSSDTVSQAPVALTKVMRLAQIASGFLGGVEEMSLDEDQEHEHASPHLPHEKIVKEISQEKLDFFFTWLDQILYEDPNAKLIVWSRFRPEILRLVAALRQRGNIDVGILIGGQKKEERDYAKRLLDVPTAPEGPAIVVGNPLTGGRGLTMVAAHRMFHLSRDYRLGARQQADDRAHRPGQRYPVSYFDLVATGPQGQKTIDHKILSALMKKDDIASLTSGGWVAALKEE